ncbi:MAG: SurA N-terminal domain-containing protein [Alphaproteobacteria bacterium]|nr:SurA N-terminal domain-containing protein [Alphaproteobacteria bacterium]
MQLTVSSQKKIFIAFFILLFTQFTVIAPALAADGDILATVGKVNITEGDVKVRSNFLLIVKNQQASASNRADIRNATIKELVNQQVQLQAATRNGITAGEAEVNKRIETIAQGAKMTVTQLTSFLKSKGSHIDSMRDLQKSGIAWRSLIRSKFGSTAQISEKLIDEEAAKLGKKFGGEQTVYDLRHIVLQMPSNANKTKRNQRLADARTVRANFSKCSRIRTLTSGLGRVKVSTMRNVSLSNLSEGQRKLVINTRVGSVSGARTIKGGVEMYAVCKKTTARNDKARQFAQSQLVQKKFEKFAADYLIQLTAEANVQYK